MFASGHGADVVEKGNSKADGLRRLAVYLEKRRSLRYSGIGDSMNDIEVVQEYVDDGFSGSNFERPAFQMMLEDIKKGKIDCVVTKGSEQIRKENI